MAAQTMAEKRIGSLLVLEAGEMVGIVTETDVGEESDRGPSPCEQHPRRGRDELSLDSD